MSSPKRRIESDVMKLYVHRLLLSLFDGRRFPILFYWELLTLE